MSNAFKDNTGRILLPGQRATMDCGHTDINDWSGEIIDKNEELWFRYRDDGDEVKITKYLASEITILNPIMSCRGMRTIGQGCLKCPLCLEYAKEYPDSELAAKVPRHLLLNRYENMTFDEDIPTCKACGKNGAHNVTLAEDELKTSNHYFKCVSCMSQTNNYPLESIAKGEWAKLNKDRYYCIECNKHIPDMMIHTWDCPDCLEPKCLECACSNCETKNL